MIEIRDFLDAISQSDPIDVYKLVDPDEFDISWENLYESAMMLFEDCHYPTENTFIDDLIGLPEYSELISVWTQINGPWREAYEHVYCGSEKKYPHSFYDSFRMALRGAATFALDDPTGILSLIVFDRTGKMPEQILELTS